MADPYFSNVVCQLTFDGTGKFIDDSSNAQLFFTKVGAVTVDAAGVSGSSGALKTNGSGSWITSWNTGDSMVFNTYDFTIEAWIKTAKGNAVLIDYYSSGNGWQLLLDSSGHLWFYIRDNPSIVGTKNLTDNVAHHIAVSRVAGVIRLFIDGVQDGANFAASANMNNMVPQLSIGAAVFNRSPSYDYNGMIDDIRITSGIGRYTTTFSPPAVGTLYTSPNRDISVTAIPSMGKVSEIFISQAIKYTQMVQALIATDFDNGGNGVISGTTKVKGTPDYAVSRRVWLLREYDGKLLREVWSDPKTGGYTFKYINPNVKYSVVSYDYTQTFRAVIASGLNPDVII